MNTRHHQYHFDGFLLDPGSRQLFSPEGTPVTLSSRAFDTLLVLIERRGQTLSKSELLEAVWPGVIVEDNNLNQAISSIRRILGDTKSESRFIQTIPGRGYCFVGQVESRSVETVQTGRGEGKSGQADERSAAETVDAAMSTDPEAMPHRGGDPMRKGRQSFMPYWVAGITSAVMLLFMITGVVLRDTEQEPEAGGLTGTGLIQSVSGPAESQLPTIIENSIAVLPLSITGGGPRTEEDLFAVGLQDELINQLAKIRSLNVISRTSVQAFMARGESLLDVGRQLGVESILTGTILRMGNSARVSLEMIDPGTGVMLWSASYEVDSGNLSDLVSVQSDIALRVAEALQAEVRLQEQEDLEALPTESFEAYRYHIAARNAYHSPGFDKAWELSRQAIQLDPDYYDALYIHASINTVLIGTPLQGMSTREHYAMALEAADRMVRLHPDKTEGYALKAAIYSTNKEWGRVAEQVEALEKIDASLADMRFLASALLVLGDIETAIRIFEANLRVEPVNLYARGFLMMAHELAGDRMKARQEYELGEELAREWWGDSVNIFLALGRGETLQDIDELPSVSDNLVFALRSINEGNLDNIRGALQRYVNDEQRAAVESLYFSAIAAYLGDQELALQLATDSVRDVWLNLHWLWLPVFDDMRRMKGFRDLIRESDLVAYWETYGWPEMCQPEGSSFSCDWSAFPH